MTLSLKDFVEAGHGSQTYVSQLTDVLVPNGDGITVRQPGPGSLDDRLQRAKERIDRFDHVGISEYFDYSMLLLAHDLGWEPFWSIPTANTAPTRTDRADLDDETIETICRVAAVDIQLYRHALARFRSDLAVMIGRKSAP